MPTALQYIWLSSKDAEKRLRICSCKLMHRREAGDLAFEKRGNDYFYRFPANDKNKQPDSPKNA